MTQNLAITKTFVKIIFTKNRNNINTLLFVYIIFDIFRLIKNNCK